MLKTKSLRNAEAFFISLPLEGKVDFLSLPKKTDEVFFESKEVFRRLK